MTGPNKSFESLNAGSLTVGGFLGTPILSEESGSPYTASGSFSINPSGLDTFDTYVVLFESVDQNGNGPEVELLIDGETGSNYNEVLLDGTQNTGQTEIGPIASHNGNDRSVGWLVFTETQMDSHAVRNIGSVIPSRVLSGYQNNTSWPPSQFTLQRSANAGEVSDWTVRVWGRSF